MKRVTTGSRTSVFGCVALAGAALLAMGCRQLPVAQAKSAPVMLLKTPDGGIQPQAVVDSQGTTHLVYYKGDPGAGDLFYQRQGARPAEWSTPIRVNSLAGSAVAMGTIRGGQLAVGKGGRVHVVWFGSKVAPKAPGNSAPLLYTRLNDAGTVFEPQCNLMTFTAELDGGPAVAADAAGNVYAAWHAGDGRAAGEEGRRFWIARSRDDGKTFAREASAWAEPTGACACCSAKAFADSAGNLHVLYRAAAEKVNRDMYLLTSRNRGDSFAGAAVSKWKVDT